MPHITKLLRPFLFFWRIVVELFQVGPSTSELLIIVVDPVTQTTTLKS